MNYILRGVTSKEDINQAQKLQMQAVGLVFMKKHPRYLLPEKARELMGQAPPNLSKVGFFPALPRYEIEELASFCRLNWLFIDAHLTAAEIAKFSLPIVTRLHPSQYDSELYYYVENENELVPTGHQAPLFLPWPIALKAVTNPVQGIILDF